MSLNSTPRTWVSGELVTAAMMNTEIRDAITGIESVWTAWSPTITAETGTFTTVSSSNCHYQRIGKTVLWVANITITTAGTASGQLRFTVPVSPLSSHGYLGSGREISATGTMLQVFYLSPTVAGVTAYNNTTIIANSRTVNLSGSYEAA